MDLHWRNTQKPARFFVFDARAFAVIFLFMIHATLWTFLLVVFAITVFWVMERRGLTFESSLRALRAWLLGRNRPALLRQRRRVWTDFG